MVRSLAAALVVLSAVVISSASPAPEPASKTPVSPDNTCGLVGAGKGKGYTCGKGNAGRCCSRFGFCGKGDDYCYSGCQRQFGRCIDTGKKTDPFVCGPKNGGLKCANSQCCSKYGWCGTAASYCVAAGCQPGFGNCGAQWIRPEKPKSKPKPKSKSKAKSKPKTKPIASRATGGRCGPAFGGAKCPNRQCCSPTGICGTTAGHCRSPDCLLDYGRCDADLVPDGRSTKHVRRPKVGNVPYGQIIRSCPGGSRHIALTYDDGPYNFTTDLLEILESYNFKATFFVTGVNLHKGRIDDKSLPWADDIRRAHREGHQIASHSWSHADLTKISASRREDEVIKQEMAIRNILGKFPTYFRPPYANCDAGCRQYLGDMGYHISYMDFDSKDYQFTTPETNQQAKDRVHAYLENNGAVNHISLVHDIHWQSVHNLTIYMLDEMVKGGWKGVTLGDCLNDPKSNWYRSA